MNKNLITQDELNALLFIYSSVLNDIMYSKGLYYKRSFKIKSLVDENIKFMKKHNININDYVEIGEN